jgi:tripartite-type tricarboxylate transporter receptor subunit TctC
MTQERCPIRMPRWFRRGLCCLPLVVMCLVGLPGIAQTVSPSEGAWPQRPIRVVVPHPPGGPSDIVARTVTDRLATLLRQPVVLENKPGAGGNIGASEVARAAPDGYTWMLGTDTIVTVNPHVYRKMPFKPEDFRPVAILSQFGQTLVCHPAVGVKTLAELIAKAKAQPMSYASGGPGVPGHLSMELLQFMGGFEMAHVPYKGPALATQDVLSGQVPCGLLAGPTVLPHVRAGKLIPLAVSGTTRAPTLPDVPTMAEAGIKDYDAMFTLALWAPRGVPDAIVNKFRQAWADSLLAPEVVERLRQTDQIAVVSTPEVAASKLSKDFVKWGAVARRINLGLD